MNKVPGYGPSNAKIMAVGEAPGAQEDRVGRPFVGKAGEFARSNLLKVGIDPEEVYWTNICKYRPPANRLEKFFKGGKPNELVQEGIRELREEILKVKPNVVIAFGAYAAWALTAKLSWNGKGFSSITAWRGSILESHMVEGQKVIPTFHPSYIMQQGKDHQGTFVCDLQKIKEDSEFPELRIPDPEFLIHPVGKQRWDAKDRLLADPDAVITFDIEYLGTNLLCVGMSNSKDWAMSIKTDDISDLDFVGECLLAGNPLNAQNAIFDCSILEYHYDLPVIERIEYDTMIAAHAANPELPKRLEYLASLYTRWPNWKNMVNWKKVKAGQQSIMDVLEYNCIDVVTQHEIMEEQWKWDLNEEMVERVFRFEMELLKVLWEMSKRGIRINSSELNKITLLTKIDLQELRIKLTKMAGQEVNVKSGPQVGDFLAGIGTKLTKTKKGNWKTDDKTLAAKIPSATDQQRDAIDLVRRTRKLRDRLSKFLEVELDEDGRSRGIYNPAGTVTGRLSSKKFFPTGKGHQQQNIPHGGDVRKLFIPDPGKEYAYFDLERAESLVVAHLTNDPVMLKHHAPGADAHRLLASQIFDCSEEEVSYDQRYLGKQTRHAGNYMEGARTMKRGVNQRAHITGVWVTEAQCKEFLDKYRSMSPYLPGWWQEVKDQLWTHGWIENLFGWRRIFHGHRGSKLTDAVAQCPQSTVGHALNMGLLATHGIITDYQRPWLTMSENEIRDLSEALRFDWGFEALQQIHDAIGFQFDPQYKPEVCDAVASLMTVRVKNPKTHEEFIIPVEAATGPSWGGVEKVRTYYGPKEVG